MPDYTKIDLPDGEQGGLELKFEFIVIAGSPCRWPVRRGTLIAPMRRSGDRENNGSRVPAPAR